jgi:hypothetical protein
MDLINYGFSVAFGMESGFAVLDESNKVIYNVQAGNPADWHSRNPHDYIDAKLLCHTLQATLPLPPDGTHFKIAFYLKDSLGSFARLSNDLEFENGYTILF